MKDQGSMRNRPEMKIKKNDSETQGKEKTDRKYIEKTKGKEG